MSDISGVSVHGDEAHSATYVHLGGSVVETITGVKTFADVLRIADGSAATPSLAIGSDTATGLFKAAAGRLGIAATTSLDLVDGANGVYARLLHDATFGGGLGLGLPGTLDVYLQRDAAGILAQRDGANAQAFRVYNTFTDVGNYERGALNWNANVLEVGTSKAGTGTARDLALVSSGTQRWLLGATTGHLTAVTGAEQIRWGSANTFPALKRSATFVQVRLGDDSGPADLSLRTLLATGQIAFGSSVAAAEANRWFALLGSFTPADTSSSAALVWMHAKLDMSSRPGNNMFGIDLDPFFEEANSGTHSVLASLNIRAAAVTDQNADVTEATSLRIVGAPTGITPAQKYAMRVLADVSRFDGMVGLNRAVPGAELDLLSGSTGRIGFIVDTPSGPTVNIAEVRNNGATKWAFRGARDVMVWPINGADPGTLADGDIWFLNSGGTLSLKARVGGVTKSVALT